MCEAGLLAVEQMILRQKGKAIFRDNAAVNIIFITDEQNGCIASETRGEQSTAQRLSKLITDNSRVASVKLHGIAPASVPANVNQSRVKSRLPVVSLFPLAKTARITGK